MAKQDEERAKRLSDALRANLRKRKEGQRQPVQTPLVDEERPAG